MASPILSSINSLITKVFSSIQISSCSSSGDSKLLSLVVEVEEMKRTFHGIRAVLADAERREVDDQSVKLWLSDLKQVAYNLEDILSEFDYKLMQSEAANAHEKGDHKRKFEVLDSVTSPLHDKHFQENMLHDIRKVRTSLDLINNLRKNLSLRAEDGHIREKTSTRRPTSSLANELEIFGRDKERNEVVHALLNDAGSNLQIISIVAMGGMGKTTLAKLVYNDERVKNHFKIRSWAWVSEAYDETRVTKAVIESLTGEACGLTELASLQNRLDQMISGKRFLILLDDVWNEDPIRWETLRTPLVSGGRGSRVLITTRNQNVASLMSNLPPINLNGLTSSASWSLFCKCVSEGCHYDKLPETLEAIGRSIVENCNGVPLMIRAMGGLLSSENDEETWNDVLTTDIWNLKEGKDWVLDVLKLSYVHLPAALKPCFLYCALFPKGHVFEKESIVRMWIAQGYIETRYPEQMEATGYKNISDLIGRSFFQHESCMGYRGYFRMHDLIHDLAQSLVLEPTPAQEHGASPNISDAQCDIIRSKYDRHFSAFVRMKAREAPLTLQSSRNQESLRSLLLCLDNGNGGHVQLGSVGNLVVLHFERDFFCKMHLRYLRILELSRCKLSELPHTIGNLKQLRYLGLSFTDIVVLPQAVCSLYNLQTLDLRCCNNLVELPKDINRLCNLRHLDYSVSPEALMIPICNLKELPEGIGRLTMLQTLPVFVVHYNAGTAGVAELRDMNCLQGPLRISCLEHITEERTGEARDADLGRKKHITWLSLEWSSHIRYGRFTDMHDQDEKVLESLQPHSNIQWLEIGKYQGSSYPRWVGDPSFRRLERVILRDFHCNILPPLGQLSSLKHLEVQQMLYLQIVGPEFYGEGAVQFPVLQTLWFMRCVSWNEWWRAADRCDFPCLQELKISYCPSLISLSLYNMTALKKLDIKGCENLVTITGLEECWMAAKAKSRASSSETAGNTQLVDNKCTQMHNLPGELEVVQIYDCMSLQNSSILQAAELTRMSRLRSNTEHPECEPVEGIVLLI